MAYFNGNMHAHGFAGEPVKRVAVTRIYCDECAEHAIPLPAHGPHGDAFGRHFETEFSWAPRYGAPCTWCGIET